MSSSLRLAEADFCALGRGFRARAACSAFWASLRSPHRVTALSGEGLPPASSEASPENKLHGNLHGENRTNLFVHCAGALRALEAEP